MVKNRLKITNVRNESLTFTSENEVYLDELHILKITFRNGLEIGMGNFPQHFLQDFPTTISRKIFPQDFPTRFPHKIFPQDFPQDFPARFPTRFSHKISCKIFPQEFPTRFSRKISRKIFPQEFPARFSSKIFPSWILIGLYPITQFQMLNSHQSLPSLNWLFPLLLVPQEFPTRFSRKIFPRWILIG